MTARKHAFIGVAGDREWLQTVAKFLSNRLEGASPCLQDRANFLGGVVKNPSYRGISASFWRSLAQVGNEDTLQVLGTPYCGKGEPNQVIRVGHASPPCKFERVAVFGGER